MALGIENTSYTENRALAEMPRLEQGSDLDGWPVAFDAYYNDHFPFRSHLIRLLYWLRLKVFRETVFPSVVVGKDSWLYFTGENNMDAYQHVPMLTKAKLRSLQRNLDHAYDVMRRDGITFLVVISPTKETIYPENLPAYIKQFGDQSRLDQFVEYMDAHGRTPVLDLRQPLLEAKQTYQVYYRNDTHWNDVGAFVAYRSILHELRDDYPVLTAHELDDYELVPFRRQGDIAQVFLMGLVPPEDAFSLAPKFEPRARQLQEGKVARIQFISEIDDPALPKILMVGDSFSGTLVPFLAEHFRSTYWERKMDVGYSIVEKLRPDVVILELNERYLGYANMVAGNWPR